MRNNIGRIANSASCHLPIWSRIICEDMYILDDAMHYWAEVSEFMILLSGVLNEE